MIGRAPKFWQRGHGGVPARLLTPAGAVFAAVAARLNAIEGARVPVPVFCCGNATVGGAGKTILALDLIERLQRRGIAPHALTRGHGGTASRRSAMPVRVDRDRHTAAMVGDEALLLADRTATWVDHDRARSGRAAIAAGATALVLDDGLQNRSLARDCSLLVIDGPVGFGNGRVLPAGPLRERPIEAVRRCRAIVLIGEDRAGAAARFRGERPILRCDLALDAAVVRRLRGRPVLAFAGIGRPDKFFQSLRDAGIDLAGCLPLPDHHRYTPPMLARLAARAASRNAVLATTAKDAVRLPAGFREQVVVVGVGLRWHDDRLDRILDHALDAAAG